MNRVYLRLDTERNISRCYEKSNQNRVNHDRIYNRAWTRIRFLFPFISSSNQIRQHWSNLFDSFDIHSFLSPSPSRITLRIREKEAEGGREDHLRELDVTGCTAAVPKDRRLEERFLCSTLLLLLLLLLLMTRRVPPLASALPIFVPVYIAATPISLARKVCAPLAWM